MSNKRKTPDSSTTSVSGLSRGLIRSQSSMSGLNELARLGDKPKEIPSQVSSTTGTGYEQYTDIEKRGGTRRRKNKRKSKTRKARKQKKSKKSKK